METLPGAPRLLGEDGGTRYVLYRKDKVAFVKGKELLKDHRLEGEAFTKRAVASCCNSAMYLEYEKGHWFSLYRDRLVGPTPPIQMRVQTRFRQAPLVEAGDARGALTRMLRSHPRASPERSYWKSGKGNAIELAPV